MRRGPDLRARVLGGRAGAAVTSTDIGGDPRPGTGWRITHEQLDLLASLLDAGVLLEAALDTVGGDGSRTATVHPARRVASRVRAGGSLQDALAGVGAPAHVVAAIAAGEMVGALPAALRSAGELVRRLEELRATLRRALVYPMIVLAITSVMLTVIATLVVPPLERSFVELGGELPRATRVVLQVSGVLRSPAFPIAIGVSVVAARLLRPAASRVRLRTAFAGLPLVGRMQRDIDVAVLARMVTMMLEGGASFVDALTSSADALPSGEVRRRASAAAVALRSGGSAFADDGLGPVLDRIEQEILAVAERTGLLVPQWRRVAERRAEALTGRVRTIGAIAEPLLIVIVGALVGGAVVALYLPTFRVLELL